MLSVDRYYKYNNLMYSDLLNLQTVNQEKHGRLLFKFDNVINQIWAVFFFLSIIQAATFYITKCLLQTCH